MTRHQKRLSAPNAWPVERKTQTFTVKAGAGPHGEAGVPLLILLRDVLGYVDSKKEARYALNEGSVLVNGDTVSDEQRPVGMFDILAFTEREEYYRVFPETGGRLALTPIDAGAADSRLGKIANKQDVGGAIQLTLHDGANIRVEEDTEYSTKDSLVVDNETKDIVAHFPYEEGALVTAVDGSHSGEIGEIDEITVTAGSGANTVSVETDSGGFETIEEYVVVIDENFVEDEDAESASDGGGESAPDADTDADAESESDTDADAETESDADADAETESDADADAETEDGGDDE